MHPEQLLAAVLIITVSTLVRSTFGFGDALIAMPLLTLVAGVTIATPLVGLVALTTAATIVIGNWRLIDLKAAWRLIVASLIGIPFGLYLLQTAPESLVKRLLGLLLIGFSLYCRHFLPVVDFLKFKEGNDIKALMEVPEGERKTPHVITKYRYLSKDGRRESLII